MSLTRSVLSHSVVLLTLSLAPAALAQATSPAAEAAPAAAPSASAPLSESLTGMARADYAAARILYEDGDYQGALQKLKNAFDASKDARLLWNMAACEKNLRHYALALGLVERYVSDGGALVSESDRAEAAAFVDTIRGFVTDLTVTVNEPGASISIDEQAVGTSPLPGPLKVDMGVHKVRVQKAGFVDFVLSQDLPGGRTFGITAQLVVDRHEGRLRIVAGPSDAIQIDGKVVGTGLWEGTMPSGTHTVYVVAKGKRPYQTDVVVKDNDVNAVHVTLQNESTSTVVVQKEGVPAWMWITGGVLAAGAGVGAYFLLKPDEGREYSAPREGTWGAIEL
jgi:hypothetical protein